MSQENVEGEGHPSYTGFMKPVRGGLLLALLALFLLLVPVTSAWAAYPGRNGLIAYSGSEHSTHTGTEIFAIPPSGGTPIQLTHNGDSDYSPAWSADGRRIVFVRGVGSREAIWTMRANGRHQHKIIGVPSSRVSEPSFSPSGGRIVFVLGRSIATVGIRGNGLRQLVFGRPRRGSVRSPEYSPNGKRIAFSGVPQGHVRRTSIWTMDRDGSHRRRVTRPRQELGLDVGPDWRADGRRILFLHLDCEDRGCDSGIYSVRPNGSRQRLITRSTSYPGVYSPTGHRIALYTVGYDNIFQNAKCADIFTVAAPRQPGSHSVTHYCDGQPTRFTGLAMDPSWQPITR